jgi:hypothetical protein
MGSRASGDAPYGRRRQVLMVEEAVEGSRCWFTLMLARRI